MRRNEVPTGEKVAKGPFILAAAPALESRMNGFNT